MFLLVTMVTETGLVTLRRNTSVVEFHSMPTVLEYSSVSEKVCTSRVSLRLSGIFSKTEGSLEFHFWSTNPPLENIVVSCC